MDMEHSEQKPNNRCNLIFGCQIFNIFFCYKVKIFFYFQIIVDANDNVSEGFGCCGYLLIGISYILCVVTFPISLIFCIMVTTYFLFVESKVNFDFFFFLKDCKRI